MKLYYEVEVSKRIDAHGEEIIETDAVEYEVDDFDIVCVYMKGKHPVVKMAIISLWNSADEEQKARFLAAIMRKNGAEIEEFYRKRALDDAFAPVWGVYGADGKSIEKDTKGAQRSKKTR